MLRHLEEGAGKEWPNSGRPRDCTVEGDLTNPLEEHLIKSDQIDNYGPMNLL